ncbi:unnamed protein product [Rodentolepis nana]|uniref:Uncharacterized protein n=1 Tax=Rodentolepis nana TaxID=102285 RepID=A0A3P7T0Y2_RODNA|nr:unnamed protein product [Rodentolepis nana]
MTLQSFTSTLEYRLIARSRMTNVLMQLATRRWLKNACRYQVKKIRLRHPTVPPKWFSTNPIIVITTKEFLMEKVNCSGKVGT